VSAAFVTHSDCLKHEMGAHHPEQPARLAAIEDQLIASGIGPHLARFDAPFATDEQLARVHPLEYVRAIRDAAPAQGTRRCGRRARPSSPRTWSCRTR
jgi:acetoin utilization deacetylase AcuC-like enzyme